ncbi:MAG: hypothetical protein DMG65_25220 [Candidatus Angelobacter sp. Gp1-AA117]|nr:MAG: hypothetical protein DMG65_25220 [Candidatus Angelobacter sp. Gp1-AA117]
MEMRMFRNNTSRALERASQYAMKSDFCAIFRQQTDRLYLLALLLMAAPQKAEECLVGSLGDCIEGNPVFKNWARAWSVRAIMKRAIRMAAPLTQERRENTQPATGSGMELTPEAAAMIAAVTHLPAFERFVFVMSVLEGYSDRDCAALLNCPASAVAAARLQALKRMELREATQNPEVYELPFSQELTEVEVA